MAVACLFLGGSMQLRWTVRAPPKWQCPNCQTHWRMLPPWPLLGLVCICHRIRYTSLIWFSTIRAPEQLSLSYISVPRSCISSSSLPLYPHFLTLVQTKTSARQPDGGDARSNLHFGEPLEGSRQTYLKLQVCRYFPYPKQSRAQRLIGYQGKNVFYLFYPIFCSVQLQSQLFALSNSSQTSIHQAALLILRVPHIETSVNIRCPLAGSLSGRGRPPPSQLR
ncbi:hypothetical protein V1521DRAFT_433001 [Lipomyces starkeyi]